MLCKRLCISCFNIETTCLGLLLFEWKECAIDCDGWTYICSWSEMESHFQCGCYSWNALSFCVCIYKSCFDQVSILCLKKPCRSNTSSTSLRHRRKALRLCSRLASVPQLPRLLQLWTRGSPRLLVYICELYTICFRTEKAKTLSTLMQRRPWNKSTASSWPKEVPQVASEVFLASKDEAEWRLTCLYLILLAQLRVPCTREMTLPIGSDEHSLDLLLGRLNVYISKPSTSLT